MAKLGVCISEAEPAATPVLHEDLSRKGFYQAFASVHSSHLPSTCDGIEQTDRHGERERCLLSAFRRCLLQHKPIAYREIGGLRQEVPTGRR